MNWNDPDTVPVKHGEYETTLQPGMGTSALRFWNGDHWSNPYPLKTPERKAAPIRQQRSYLTVYWREYNK